MPTSNKGGVVTTPPTRMAEDSALPRLTGKTPADRYTTDRSGSPDRRSGSAGRTQRWHQVTSPHMRPDMWEFQRMQMIHLHILRMPEQLTRNLLRMLAAHMTHMLTHRRMIQCCSSHWMRNRGHSSSLSSHTPSPLLPPTHPNQLHIPANNLRPSCCPSRACQAGPSRRQVGCPGQDARSDSRHAQIVRLHRHALHRPHQHRLRALHLHRRPGERPRCRSQSRL